MRCAPVSLGCSLPLNYLGIGIFSATDCAYMRHHSHKCTRDEPKHVHQCKSAVSPKTTCLQKCNYQNPKLSIRRTYDGVSTCDTHDRYFVSIGHFGSSFAQLSWCGLVYFHFALVRTTKLIASHSTVTTASKVSPLNGN